METLIDQINQFLNRINLQAISGPVGGQILRTIAVILVLWGLRRLVLSVVARQSENPTTLFAWRRASSYAVLVIGTIFVWSVWATEGAGSDLAAYFGLLSAGLAIALQDPLSNFTGWLFILFRRPFEIGDRIEINGQAGDVVDTHFFQFTLLEIKGWIDAEQSTGRVIHVPNKFVFTNPVANYSKGLALIWNEIPVEVTFESDWKKAKEILIDIASKRAKDVSQKAHKQMRKAAQRYGIRYEKVTPTVYTRVEASGVKLTLRYLCEPRKRRITEQAIWEEILNSIAAQDDIDFAYPTQRIYYHPTEGKTLQEEPHVQVVLPPYPTPKP